VAQAIRFAQQSWSAGKDVQMHHYDEAGHLFMFESRTKEDVFQRTVEFLNRHLQR